MLLKNTGFVSLVKQVDTRGSVLHLLSWSLRLSSHVFCLSILFVYHQNFSKISSRKHIFLGILIFTFWPDRYHWFIWNQELLFQCPPLGRSAGCQLVCTFYQKLHCLIVSLMFRIFKSCSFTCHLPISPCFLKIKCSHNQIFPF